MIQMKSKLAVADNSGAKVVMCIKPIKASWIDQASIGDTIVVSVKSADPHGKVKKGDVKKAVLIRVRSPITRSDGSVIKFDDNAVVLVNEQGDPVGSRVFGAVARELREKNFLKIVSLAQEVI